MTARAQKAARSKSIRIPDFALACLVLAALCLCLAGCHAEQKKDMESKEPLARTYYNDKYKTDASVSEAKMCESDSTILSTAPNGDYRYLMSDGSTVMYLGETKSFIDDRQYDVIKAAIVNGVWNPQMQKLRTSTNPQDFIIYGLDFGIHKSGHYQGKGFATYYNGDINKLMQEERPTITFEKVMMLTDNASDEEQLCQFCTWINDKFTPKMGSEMVCVSPDSLTANGQPIHDESYCEIIFTVDGVRVNKPRYITLTDGVEITADKYGFQLEEGDITIEPVPTSELQAKIDEVYNALPYESEENSGNNYKKRDQVHEDRDVLLEGTAFKVHFSERVKNVSDNNGLSCRLRFSDQLTKRGYYLFKYRFDIAVPQSSGSIICMPKSQMEFNSLPEDGYIFLGKVERGKAGGESKTLG